MACKFIVEGGLRYLFLITFLLFLSGISHASELRFVDASNLNVRSEPSNDGEILYNLKRGTPVVINSISSDWANIGYLKEGSQGLNKGWVAMRFLGSRNSSLGGVPTFGGEEEFQSKEDANYSLNIEDVDFKCKEGLFDKGFDRCKVTISVSASTDYQGDETPNVDYSCDVDLSVTDTKDWTSRKSDSAYGSIWVNYGSGMGTLDMSIRVASLFDPIISAKIKDLSCRINNIW